MNFSSFNLGISDDLIRALSWTLIHSVWQGLLLAILAGAVLSATRRSKPTLKYNVLIGLVLLFVVVNIFTFYIEFKSAGSENVRTAYLVGYGHSVFAENELHFFAVQRTTDNWLHNLLDICAENATFIVTLWLIIFVSKCLRAIADLIYIHRLKHGGHKAAKHWQQKLKQLAERLTITHQVLLLESKMVTIPTVIGFFKPIILVPVGFLTNIPYLRVEAILLHELAHIRRWDFLVNLLQAFAENIYFFNPAVVWISHLIREEREHCCDDLAIASMPNKTAFVTALIEFLEFRHGRLEQLIAFAGSRNHMLERVKRIIYNRGRRINVMEQWFVTANVFMVIALLGIFLPDFSKTSTVSRPPSVALNVLSSWVAKARSVSLVPPPTYTRPISPKSNLTAIHSTRGNKKNGLSDLDGKVAKLIVSNEHASKEKIENSKEEIHPIVEKAKKILTKTGEFNGKGVGTLHHDVDFRIANTKQLRNEVEWHGEQANKLRENVDLQIIIADKQIKDADTQLKRDEEALSDFKKFYVY